jgi:hypothetical protein
MPKVAKKKVAAKKTAAPAKKSASRGRGRPPGSKNKNTSTKSESKKATTSKKKSNLPTREFNKETGFVVGSDQDFIASALLKGADTRQDIIDFCRKKLDSETRNGTEKPVSNLVSSVFNKMVGQGYRLESHYQLLPPTPASKRKAAKK